MVDNPTKLDQVGDISNEDMLQFLLDSFFSPHGRPKSYNCSKCGEKKSVKTNVNGWTVSIPHCCPDLLERVQEWAKNRDMDISKEQIILQLKEAEARMKADSEADRSKTKKTRGPRYKCGRCRLLKVKHCKCGKAKRTSKQETSLKR